MSRFGVVGLVFGLFSLTVAVLVVRLFHRWCVRRLPLAARHPRVAFGALLAPMLVGPPTRWLVLGGLDDRWSWLDALGQLWALGLLCAVGPIYAWEAWLARRVTKKPLDEHLAAPSRREALVGGAFVGVSLAPLLWGVRQRFDFEVVELPIRVPRLPRALDGLTVVQVSDVHIGAFLGEAVLEDARGRIAKLRPDLVVMTGDLVHVRPSYLPLGMAWLRRLDEGARFGLLSILGNHEYYVGRAAVLEAYDRANLELLLNRSKVVAEGLVVAGVDDLWGSGRGFGPDLDRALAGASPDAARLLLCHQPSFHRAAAARGVDLQLSGHTHGGQIAPFGPLAARAMFGAYKGLYRVGGSSLYVNRGFGTSGPPSRVAVRPEITKIVLVAG